MVGTTVQSAGVVCAVADALRGGDEVVLNDRTNALAVLGRDVDASHGFVSGSDYPYRVVWLRGNGTEYRLRYSHTGNYRPTLHTEGHLETRERFCHRCREEHPVTWASGSGERVRRIAVRGIEDERLSEWAFRRNIDSLDAATESGPGDEGGRAG